MSAGIQRRQRASGGSAAWAATADEWACPRRWRRRRRLRRRVRCRRRREPPRRFPGGRAGRGTDARGCFVAVEDEPRAAGATRRAQDGTRAHVRSANGDAVRGGARARASWRRTGSSRVGAWWPAWRRCSGFGQRQRQQGPARRGVQPRRCFECSSPPRAPPSVRRGGRRCAARRLVAMPRPELHDAPGALGLEDAFMCVPPSPSRSGRRKQRRMLGVSKAPMEGEDAGTKTDAMDGVLSRGRRGTGQPASTSRRSSDTRSGDYFEYIPHPVLNFIRRDEHDLSSSFRSGVERAMSWSRAWRAGARLSRAASIRASSAFESSAALAAVSDPSRRTRRRLVSSGTAFRRSFASSASRPRAGDASSSAAPMHGFDPERGGLAELTDVFHPEPVDEVSPARSMQFVEAGYLRDFGGILRFSGPASTVRCFENNPLVREALNEPGRGRVLVVDGGGSKRCALLGDNLAGSRPKTAGRRVINGCLRDAERENPCRREASRRTRSSPPTRPGVRDVPVSFAGVSSWGLGVRGHGRGHRGGEGEVRAVTKDF